MQPSPADRNLLATLQRTLPDGMLTEGIIIDQTSGRWCSFGLNDSPDIREGSGVINPRQRGRYDMSAIDATSVLVPDPQEDALAEDMPQANAPVYRFDRRIFSRSYDYELLTKVRSSEDIAEFVSAVRLGEGHKLSYVLMDNAGHIIGNIHTAYAKFRDEDIEPLAQEMLSLAARHAAASVALYGNDPGILDRSRLSALKMMLANRMGGLRLLDALSVKKDGSFKSANDEGIIREPEPEYGSKNASEPRREGRVFSENALPSSEASPVPSPAEEARFPEESRLEAYSLAKGIVEAAGVPVVEVSDAEAQAMLEQAGLDTKKTPLNGQPNRADEKPTSGRLSAAHSGDSSSNATDSRKPDAKIIKNTQSAKNKIKKFNNGDFDIQTSTLDKAMSGIGSILAMRSNGGSRYTVLRTDGGSLVAVRLSDHAANGNNFGRDGADRNLSIVIERRRFDAKDSAVEFTEVTIPLSTFEADPMGVVRGIVNGVEDVLADGEFTLPEALGTVETKGGVPRLMQTPNGRVYGWTLGGKVFVNRDALDPDTPIHEYTHLWDDMVRRENPALWKRGVELMKELPLWKEVEEDPAYAHLRDDDAIASEVHSRLTGKRGAEYIRRFHFAVQNMTKYIERQC